MYDPLSVWRSIPPWYPAEPGVISGQPLRYLLTTLLAEAGRPLAIRDLIDRCEAEGVVFDRRASKVISDALRWEIQRGRVTRMRRGVYRVGAMPRSTQHWIRTRVRIMRGWLAPIRPNLPSGYRDTAAACAAGPAITPDLGTSDAEQAR